jgi:hypothetical protein
MAVSAHTLLVLDFNHLHQLHSASQADLGQHATCTSITLAILAYGVRGPQRLNTQRKS